MSAKKKYNYAHINVSCSSQQKSRIVKQAKANDMTVSKYICYRLLNNRGVKTDYHKLNKLFNKDNQNKILLNKIGNNINQIAYKLNSGSVSNSFIDIKNKVIKNLNDIESKVLSNGN